MYSEINFMLFLKPSDYNAGMDTDMFRKFFNRSHGIVSIFFKIFVIIRRDQYIS